MIELYYPYLRQDEMLSLQELIDWAIAMRDGKDYPEQIFLPSPLNRSFRFSLLTVERLQQNDDSETEDWLDTFFSTHPDVTEGMIHYIKTGELPEVPEGELPFFVPRSGDLKASSEQLFGGPWFEYVDPSNRMPAEKPSTTNTSESEIEISP